MKPLTKKDARKVCQLYRLGELQGSPTQVKHGCINDTYMLDTDQGKYVAQAFTQGFERWKQGRLKQELSVLTHLRAVDFPYEIPQPVISRNGSNFSHINGRKMWTYPYLNGELKSKLTTEEFKGLARVQAEYHTAVKPLEDLGDKEFKIPEVFDYFLRLYEDARSIKPKNSRDRLLLENIDYFQNILRGIRNLDYGPLIPTHSDFAHGNILYDRDSISGIIDFDNIEVAPAAKDIGISVLRTDYAESDIPLEERIQTFTKAYGEVRALSQQDKDLVIPCMLRELSLSFLWVRQMWKNKHWRDSVMKSNLAQAKELVELVELKNAA